MNEEFNNSVESVTETTDTTKPTLNGEAIVTDEEQEVVKKKSWIAFAIIIACAALIMVAVFFIVKKTVNHEDKGVASVSTTNSDSETSVSEETVSTEAETPEGKEYTVASSDFSAGLTEEGYVKDADLTKVTDLALDGMEVPYASIVYIDDKVDSDLLSAAEQYAFYSDDASLTVQNGNTINLNYSGSIDGVVFDGGTADYQTLTIGSGSFIDNFEEQLIGAHPGDDVNVTVTFPDPYSNNPDLAGKEAVFACHVNSIYTIPEVDDAFVQTYFSDLADNVDDLKAYVKEQGTQSNLDSYIANYINGNASVSEIPEEYLKYLKSLIRYADEQSFAQYQTYMMYYGYTDAANMAFSEYTGMTDDEYESYLDESATNQAVLDMTYEALFKNSGLSINEEDYNMIMDYYGGEETATATYGAPFIKQTAIKYSVIHYYKERANITGAPTE
ncbi:MAG: FKBP-type peptidyl-prolyl cis-trans isomerase [Lachnospiraceae bacterium]|nr:FKBP-type peptidyl-prolyl cis-trans isomerase [Lachnospiraceae bacterium]